MSILCHRLHKAVSKLKKYGFPFDEKEIPKNGVDILFQKGERAHGTQRIVRVGAHNGADNLFPRLKEHFLVENKDRSIFRKNIGRAILSKNSDPFLKYWEIDLTTKAARRKHASSIDLKYQQKIEDQVSVYIQKNFFFVIVPIQEKDDRQFLKSKIISTVSWCEECKPSKTWLGTHSPKSKIRKSGMWLGQHLWKNPFTDGELLDFEKLVDSNIG